MSLSLYHSPISTCSQKVRLALAEKGLDYDSRIIELARQEHLEAWYLAINPNGVVPSLVHNGGTVHGGS
jgi:glutathione S-transferase